MKMKINLFAAMLVFSASMSFMSCGSNSGEQKDAAGATAESKNDSTPVQASAYICPMKCEKGYSDKPGSCGDCGMDLVENKEK